MAVVRLYVSNLAEDATDDELRTLFREVGRPTLVHKMFHRDTGRFRNSCFITLDTLGAPADCWREALQGRKLGSRHLHIDFAYPNDRKWQGVVYQEENKEATTSRLATPPTVAKARGRRKPVEVVVNTNG